MGDADFLSNVFATISSRSAAVEEKKDRLRMAKQDIISEQSYSMNEIKNVKNPTLDLLWNGSRANTFDDSRGEAHRTMESIVNDYDYYVGIIDSEIRSLDSQQWALDVASSLAHEADQLLEAGEEALDALGNKISEIKGWLF